MNSMTGYGFEERIVDGTQVSVEIRSVNSRFLDLNVGLPPFLNPLEARIRKIVGERAVRGKIDVSIRVKDTRSNARVSVDTQAAVAYFLEFRKIVSAIRESGGYGGDSEGSIPLSLVIGQDGVLSVTHEYDAEAYWAKVEPVLAGVLAQFSADRAREGENLRKDLLAKLSVLDSCAQFFREWQPKMEERFREQVRSKFEELLGERVDENRIMAEVASMLVRYTINEEIVRLSSHLQAMRKEICENPYPGKRLDFICQEANREINTIGSKNQFTEVGERVVDAKDAIENIREQSKNVE